jgi:hypothetical protein
MNFKVGDLIINHTGRVVLIEDIKKDAHVVYYGTYIKHPQYNLLISNITTVYPWENYRLMSLEEKAELV